MDDNDDKLAKALEGVPPEDVVSRSPVTDEFAAVLKANRGRPIVVGWPSEPTPFVTEDGEVEIGMSEPEITRATLGRFRTTKEIENP